MPTNTSAKGLYAAIFSSLLSSLGIVIQAEAIKLLGPLTVCAGASLFGSLILLTLLFLRGEYPDLALLRRHLASLISLTILRGVVGALLFVYALSLTPSIKAMFFTKAEPYLVIFWSWLLGRGGIARREGVLLVLHIAAAVVLSTSGRLSFERAQLGDLLILLALACSSLSYIVGKSVTQAIGAKLTNALTQLFSAVLLLPAAIYLAPPGAWNFVSLGWAYLWLQVLMFNIIALTLWFYAIKTIDGWIVSALRAVGPLAAAPFAWYLFDQSLTPLQLAAGGVVLATSAAIARQHIISKAKVTL
ncbi:MAG: DMT family transporter [Deltaproteobacteria bacterium]|nr:DMT family transporter [Deltaproteobacteria bacterium]